MLNVGQSHWHAPDTLGEAKGNRNVRKNNCPRIEKQKIKMHRRASSTSGCLCAAQRDQYSRGHFIHLRMGEGAVGFPRSICKAFRAVKANTILKEEKVM